MSIQPIILNLLLGVQLWLATLPVCIASWLHFQTTTICAVEQLQEVAIFKMFFFFFFSCGTFRSTYHQMAQMVFQDHGLIHRLYLILLLSCTVPSAYP